MKTVKIAKNPPKAKNLTDIKKKKTKVVDKKEEKPLKKAVKKLKETKSDDAITAAVSKKAKTSSLKKPKDGKKAGKPKKKSHQDDLEGLKDLDPEFYNFLKQNDKKLLEFNMLDSDDSEEEEEDVPKDKKDTKKDKKKPKKGEDAESDSEPEDNEEDEGDDDDEDLHQPSGDLEVASDESDYEAEDGEDIDTDGSQKITLNLLRQWQLQLEQQNVPIDIIRKVVQGFSSALASITADGENQSPTSFKVVGAAAFNGVVQLCVLHLQPAILRYLGIATRSNVPIHKTKKWVKVRGCLRYYLTDLIRLVEQVSSANILSVLLKHLHQMSGMIAPFATLGKNILKRLITLWATSDETVRVLAFLCILKITRNQQVSMLHHVLKAMYLSYVRNSKFVSPNNLPCINFMRRSLVEMFALDLNASYQHAFLYIRQLAIHLRNAVILKKKDSFKAIYNWQYVNSIRLWADLLGATANKPQMQPLVYPLVTITMGAIRLIPTAQYFPLRFHCLQALISLAKSTHTFIPVLPLILEVLNSNTFNRKHTAVSMKPLQFTCILRLNKAQLAENGFRDEVVEQVVNLTLEYLAHESSSLAFSDLVVPTVVALKKYLKECRNANYSRKIKQLLDKIQENSRFVDTERRKITFGLKDLPQVQAWEVQLKNKGTPLSIYYASWVKMHETKKRRQAAQTDTINADYGVPSIKRKAKGGVAIKNDDGEVELFPSDSEDDGPEVGTQFDDDDDDAEEESEEEAKPKAKSMKEKKEKKSKKKTAPVDETPEVPVEEDDLDGGVDIVKDLDLDDW